MNPLQYKNTFLMNADSLEKAVASLQSSLP